MHQLDITYHNTYNCKSLRIEDNSIYEKDLEVLNPILEVKPPGLISYVAFPFPNKNWKSKTLNCSSLKICCGKKPATLSVLPDGVYHLKYSVDPNRKCMVEFCHMRICLIMCDYMKIVCSFFSEKCCSSQKERDALQKELLSIKDMIDGAIYAVEECLDNQLGLELYEEAKKRINRIKDGDFNCCC